MKTKLYVLTAILTFQVNYAQIPEITETDPSTLFWVNQQPTIDLQKLNAVRGLDYSNVDFYVKIYLHVLRRADGSGGQSVENVNRMLQRLYSDFDIHGIHFVQGRDTDIDYIDNDAFYIHPQANYDSIFATNSHTDGIDIYLFDDIDSSNNGGVVVGVGETTSLLMGGYLYLPSKSYFSPLNRTPFVSKLMGKIFYLYNTHFGTNGNPNGCRELVNGSNCNDCGDYICDTPADPNILFNVNSSCVYTPDPNDNIPDVDTNGDPYAPDASNIMSFTMPYCWNSFSPQQVTRMKNALGYLPQLQSTHLQNYVFVRADNDCYSCFNQSRTFNVYSNYNLNQLYPISSNNVETEIIDQTSEYLTIKVTNLIGDGEGERGDFSIVRTGIPGGTQGIIEATQHLWVGLPQTVPDATLNGPDQASSNQGVGHVLQNRIDGVGFYGWDTPIPQEIIWGGEDLDPEVWQHYGYDQYFRFSSAFAGNQTGYVTVRGENPCGEGDNGVDNDICVVNSDDPEGDTECDPIPAPIYYYPNPADSLLEIDLSLQEYKIFDVVIYDENQTVKYSGQSENVVKTVDTFNLTNGTYYLHIYDGSDLILSAILIINH